MLKRVLCIIRICCEEEKALDRETKKTFPFFFQLQSDALRRVMMNLKRSTSNSAENWTWILDGTKRLKLTETQTLTMHAGYYTYLLAIISKLPMH